MPPSTEQKAAIFAPSKFKKKVFSPERSRDVKNKAGIGLSSGETLTRPERGQHAVTEALIQKLQSSQEAFAKDPIGCFLLSFYCFSCAWLSDCILFRLDEFKHLKKLNRGWPIPTLDEDNTVTEIKGCSKIVNFEVFFLVCFWFPSIFN